MTHETLTMEAAVELVGIDACTEARNGVEQPLDDGGTLTANGDGTFNVVRMVEAIANTLAEQLEDDAIDLLPQMLPVSLQDRIENDDALSDDVFDELHAAFRAGLLEMARRVHAIALRHRS